MVDKAKTTTKEEAEVAVCDILSRGAGIFVDPKGVFKKKLIAKAQGTYEKDVIVKFGVDPTRPDIHLGHAVVLRKLRQFQDLGCKVVFLIGDFTSQIGDPTGKSKTRPEIEQAQVEVNMKTYLDQVGKILNLDQTVFSWIRNSDWFTTITDMNLPPEYKVGTDVHAPGQTEKIHIEFPPNSLLAKTVVFEETRMQKKLGVSQTSVVTLRSLLWGLKHITHAQLIERDIFQKRLKDGESLYMHEMLYPVFQGIDSDVLAQVYGSCDAEVGGTDQTFNMLMGRKIMEINGHIPQAVLSIELLVGLDGKEKMSKSLDNYVGITEDSKEMFGKIMSLPDSSVVKYFELCAFTPMEELGRIAKKLSEGANPRDSKMDLGEQIVEIYHGREAARAAKEGFVQTFQKKELPEDMAVVKVHPNALLADVLLAENIVSSKGEFRRLIEEGAIRENAETKISDLNLKIERDTVFKIGKHRFLKVIVGE